MDAYGVDVFHVAHRDGGVGGIAYSLVFHFFISADAFFHQHLMHRGKLERVFQHFGALRFIVGKAAARAAQSKGGAQHHGIAYALCRLKPLLHGLRRCGGQHRLANLGAQLLVLRALYAAGVGAQQLHAALGKHALFIKLHCKVKPGLPAYAGQHGVGSLVSYYPCQIFQCKGLHVHLVGYGGVRHYGSGVGVAQHHLIALLAKRKAGLRAGIVKFRRLAYYYGAGAYHQYFMDITALWHCFFPPLPAP